MEVEKKVGLMETRERREEGLVRIRKKGTNVWGRGKGDKKMNKKGERGQLSFWVGW